MKKALIILLGLLFVAQVASAQQMAEASGESVINNNDVQQARNEAILRAKWTAAESVLGVKVKAQSVVANFALVDEVVQKSVSGYVRTYKVLTEGRDGDVYRVRIAAEVVRDEAEKAMTSMLRVSSVAILLPSFGLHGDVDESNVFSESLTGRIVDQGYTVMDMASLEPGLAGQVEQAIKRNDALFARSLMLKSLSNLALLGKIDFTVSTRKGDEVGYGLSMPFNIVTARVNYKLISAVDKKVVLAGSDEAKGKAFNEKDAAAQAMKQLSDKLAPAVIGALGKYMQGATKKIRVTFENMKGLGETLGIKETLQNLSWVKSVEEVRLGEYTVEYPENTVYLANSILQNPQFKLKDFSQYSISIKIEK